MKETSSETLMHQKIILLRNCITKNVTNPIGILFTSSCPTERSIYPFEDVPVAGKKRVIYRSTPFGRPDATTSTVTSVLGVTAPLARPVLAKQRTKDISEVSVGKKTVEKKMLILFILSR